MFKQMLFGTSAFAQSAGPNYKAMAIPTISGVVHLEGYGDRPLVGGQWAGTKGESRRMEGISLQLSDTGGALRIEYLCHLEGLGDVGPVAEGAFCGTRGQSRRLEALQIRLAGPAAQFFTVRYECHLQDKGDTGPVSDYATCGTRGESRRLEAVRIVLDRK
jgi:hydrophobic W protein